MIAHRDSVADKICEEILGQELVKSLLRSTEKCDLDRAFLDMQKVFRSAAELSVEISTLSVWSLRLSILWAMSFITLRRR